MKTYLLLVAAPLLLAASPTTDPETIKDVRCFVALSSLAASKDSATSMSGVIGAQYFLGRIDGRDPALDLETAIAAEASRLTEADLASLLSSCGQLMKSRGEAVKAMGERMQKQENQSSSSSS